MKKPLLAWAISGSRHYIEECLDFLVTLDAVDVYINPADEEMIKKHSINNNMLREKMPVYRDKAASTLPCRAFLQKFYHTFVMAPTSSNTVAKCILGIADSLVTNLCSQAGKCHVPSIVYPHDIASEMEPTVPRDKMMVYPRKVDLEATDKLRSFEYTQVLESVEALIVAVNKRLKSSA